MMPISSILLARLKAASDMHLEHDQFQASNQPQSSSFAASLANSTARDYYERYMSALSHNQNQNFSTLHPLSMPSTSTIPSKACLYEQTSASGRGSLEYVEPTRVPDGANNNLPPVSLAHQGHHNQQQNHQQHQQQQQRQQHSNVQPTSARAPLNFPCHLIGQHSKRKRRHRTIFSEEQLAQLESIFCRNQYPDVTLREHLSSHINLKEARIEVWFKNRRAKLRKQQRDSQHPAIALGPDAASLLGQRLLSESGMLFQNFDPIYAMPTMTSGESSASYAYNQQLEHKTNTGSVPNTTGANGCKKSQADGRSSK